MFRAMALKELREIRGILLLVLAVYVLVMMYALLTPGTNWGIFSPYTAVNPGPFLTSISPACYWCFTIILAAALGLWQTLGESIHGAWPFLLHRPASRHWLIGTKLLVGLGSYFVCGAAIIVTLGVLSAMPGVYASPFFWWMTVSWWVILFRMTLVYLAAFIVGLRPARWYGTRLLPLVAALGAIVFVLALEPRVYGLPDFLPLRLAAVLLVDAALVHSILFVARARDYT